MPSSTSRPRAANQTWLPIDPGELRSKVTILAPPASPDSFGQVSQSNGAWTNVGTFWARIRVAGARELYQAGAMTSQVTHVIEMRWPGSSVSIAAGMRATSGGHTYLIQAPENVDERNILLELLVLELNGVE